MLNQVDPLAQLEERYLHTVEVAGSSPVGITIEGKTRSVKLWVFYYLK